MPSRISFDRNGDVYIQAPEYPELQPFAAFLAHKEIEFTVTTAVNRAQLVFELPADQSLEDHLALVLALSLVTGAGVHPPDLVERAQNAAHNMVHAALKWGGY